MNRFVFSIFSICCFSLYSFESVIHLKHTEGKGIGFNQGYSSIDYLGMENWNNVEALINLRGHVFNSGDFAGNGGIGTRFKTSQCSLFGLYGFYDFRQYHNLFIQQVSAGTEFLTKWADFRLNGYLPVGKNCAVQTQVFNRFSGNTIEVKKKFTGALPMVEFEIGAQVRPEKIYFTAGPYYLFHNTTEGKLTKAGWGGKVHMNVNIGDYFSFGGGVSYDSVFDFGGTGFAAINIPFGKKSKKMRSNCGRTTSMRSMPIMRNEIIPVEKRTTLAPLGQDTEGGTLLSIVFVNNAAPEGGDGTFESPFSSLLAAEEHSAPGDIIYVFPGDGTSYNMDAGIELQEGQILVSSGHDFMIDDVAIPALTPGVLPVITNINLNDPVVKNRGADQGLLTDFFSLFNTFVGP